MSTGLSTNTLIRSLAPLIFRINYTRHNERKWCDTNVVT